MKRCNACQLQYRMVFALFALQRLVTRCRGLPLSESHFLIATLNPPEYCIEPNSFDESVTSISTCHWMVRENLRQHFYERVLTFQTFGMEALMNAHRNGLANHFRSKLTFSIISRLICSRGCPPRQPLAGGVVNGVNSLNTDLSSAYFTQQTLRSR